MLFCEPKNRKSPEPFDDIVYLALFQCSSASRKIGNHHHHHPPPPPPTSFSALLRAEKSEMVQLCVAQHVARRVSVLFCEPKNRKFASYYEPDDPERRFSALLRAEKSEIPTTPRGARFHLLFQCSSASRKIGNPPGGRKVPSRIQFQCSSASRKIGNRLIIVATRLPMTMFQCSSASRKIGNFSFRPAATCHQTVVSVLFCEPKNRKLEMMCKDEATEDVSVLFCEPKNRK